MGKSYGFIEIPSTTAAIDALDIMCKTADVEFVTWEKTRWKTCHDYCAGKCVRSHTGGRSSDGKGNKKTGCKDSYCESP